MDRGRQENNVMMVILVLMMDAMAYVKWKKIGHALGVH